MICPSCSHDNIEGADRCEECVTSLFNLNLPQAGREGLSRSVMKDDLRQLEQEFLGVAPDTSALQPHPAAHPATRHSLDSVGVSLTHAISPASSAVHKLEPSTPAFSAWAWMLRPLSLR